MFAPLPRSCSSLPSSVQTLRFLSIALHNPPTRHAACSASKLNLESIHFSPYAISHHSTQFASFLVLITVVIVFINVFVYLF